MKNQTMGEAMEAKRPYVFIGSSSEGLSVAQAIQVNLDHSCECQIWSQGVFGLSEGPMESLIKSLDRFDFAILVLTPDDVVFRRGESKPTPRDNVVFELGLFIGGLGRERTFMVCERGTDLKLPSDLTGIEPAMYQQPASGTLQSALGAACTRIEEAVRNLGGRSHPLVSVKIRATCEINVEGQQGINFTVKNAGSKAIPPYKICIVHPRCGTFFMFPSKVSGELLPDQERSHFMCVLVGGQPARFCPDLKRDQEGKPLTDTDDQEFAFRMVLEHSDKVLYESKKIGLGFVRALRKVLDQRTIAAVLYEDFLQMSSYE
jgi:hypothetical protein